MPSPPSNDATDKDFILIEGLRKTYQSERTTDGSGTVVFDGFDLAVKRGEFVTIFGPNGCGKSTLLHVLAGVVPRDAGTVQIGGQEPGRANVGFVFQSFQASLFPWKRNVDNIGWPLELQGVPRTERRERVRRFLQDMNIAIPEDRYPYRLSGGQQQLISIARALVAEPKVLLMDEPFNQLDYQTRMTMHLDTLELWARTGTTVLFVSHDIEEALLLGDRTVLLSKLPARVLRILDNPLPRPRSHAMLKSQEFFRLKSEALEVFAQALAV